ncbi:MAG TPA: DUF885 domain-containing protein [Flavipsychrobacter sp.]|nr:DUF885 domain-containing protein [Flavipsychrobacter sp.]
MKKAAITIALCLSIFVFDSNQVRARNNNMNNINSGFDNYKNNFVEALWKIYPTWASSVGYHKYDSVLVIPNDVNRKKELAFCKANLDSLKSFNLSELSDNNKTDYHLIENQLQSTQWAITEEKEYEWNPAMYNVSESFAVMLGNDYEPLDKRLRDFYIRMKDVPAYYDAAKKNIKSPTVEHTQLAIEQNEGGLSTFEGDLRDSLKKSKLSKAEKIQIYSRSEQTIAAIVDYTEWLKHLTNDHPRSFRLGKELYAKKFEFDIQSAYTADQIYKKAVEHKDELHKEMYAITQQLWPKYFPGKSIPENKLIAIKEMIDTLSVNHVAPDSFQAAIEEQLPKLIAFIKKKDLIYIDPSKPLVVRKEPGYMAGVAGASITAPGPYDKEGNTYYNVGSLEGWSKERSESYLREYNDYILQILNMHEAIPGHYTQLVYSNQSPSIIKSILGNGAMIEGWAVYTERMMLENGYDSKNTEDNGEASPEMWLMYYKWNLRSTCNTILDYSVHAKNMSKEDAINMLTNEAFQQQAEAEGKWKRVSVTQVQLCSYFTGYTEIYEFRDELKKKEKNRFKLKQFHEKFLSYGSAPVKYIKQLMLEEMD